MIWLIAICVTGLALWIAALCVREPIWVRVPIVGMIGAAAITVFPLILDVDRTPPTWRVRHERAHWHDQRRWALWGVGVGLLAWWALYLLALPVGWNPWRFDWEARAIHAEGPLLSHHVIANRLRGRPYYLWWM